MQLETIVRRTGMVLTEQTAPEHVRACVIGAGAPRIVFDGQIWEEPASRPVATQIENAIYIARHLGLPIKES